MHRLLLVASIVAASACTSEPTTDTGQLVRIHEGVFASCQENVETGATCNYEVTFTENRFEARGLFDNGSYTNTTNGTLSDQAQLRLAELVSNIPLESPDTVHDVGCGGPPERATTSDVNFVHDGLRHFTIEYTTNQALNDFASYANKLVTDARTCTSTDLAFDNCEPNIY